MTSSEVEEPSVYEQAIMQMMEVFNQPMEIVKIDVGRAAFASSCLAPPSCYLHALQRRLKWLAFTHNDLVPIIAGYCMEIGFHMTKQPVLLPIKQEDVLGIHMDSTDRLYVKRGDSTSTKNRVIEVFVRGDNKYTLVSSLRDKDGFMRIFVHEQKTVMIYLDNLRGQRMLSILNATTFEKEATIQDIPWGLKDICNRSGVMYNIDTTYAINSLQQQLRCYQTEYDSSGASLQLKASHTMSDMIDNEEGHAINVTMDQSTHRLLLSIDRFPDSMDDTSYDYAVLQMDPGDVKYCKLQALVHKKKLGHANDGIDVSVMLFNDQIIVVSSTNLKQYQFSVYQMTPNSGIHCNLELMFTWKAPGMLHATVNYSTGELIVVADQAQPSMAEQQACVYVFDMEY